MSTKNRIATLGALLAVMATPALVSAQGVGNYTATQALLSAGAVDAQARSSEVVRLKRGVPSGAHASRQTQAFKVPIDAFGAAIGPGFEYGGAGMAYGTAVANSRGRVIGADPDAAIRFELRRDSERDRTN
jgi:hypothetical protein